MGIGARRHDDLDLGLVAEDVRGEVTEQAVGGHHQRPVARGPVVAAGDRGEREHGGQGQDGEELRAAPAAARMIPVHMPDPIENDSRSQTATAPAVEAVGLTLAHGSQVAVRDATFTVPVGGSTALIGPNGSGKSTLLHAIAGLHAPRGGTLRVLGGRATDRDEIAYVPQHLHANQHLPISAREVVTMGCYAQRGAWGRLTDADREAVAESMARLDVTHLARRQLGSLSGGERQRVLVAQALAQGAPLLLLDEPLTGLDLPSQEHIVAVVDEERAAGHTVVASTHSLADAASADHLLLLAGRVVASGTPDEVLTEANLSTAYGPMVIRFGERGLLLDDSTHHHPN